MRMSLALISYKQWKKERSRRRRRRRREDLVAKMVGGRKEDMNLVKKVIPFDVQVEILIRLPSKSLMRFKCVSKLWYSLIRSRFFANLYLKPPQTPRLYMNLVDHNHSWDNPKGCVLMSSSSSNNAKSFHEDLTMPVTVGCMMVVLRGLLLYFRIYSTKAACIFNPATRQILTLPAVVVRSSNNVEGFRKFISYFLGYDHVLDQYKVVCNYAICSPDLRKIITSEHWVLTLEPGSCWRRIECDQFYLPTRQGFCINGVIYYTARTTSESQSYLVSFNVRSEELTIIQLPPLLSGSFSFIEYGGKPTMMNHTHFYESGLVDLWVLEDIGKWSKKSMVLKLCQMHLIDNLNLKVKGTTNKGEVILAPFPLFSHYYVLYYDLHNNHLRKVRIRGIPKHWFRMHASEYNFLFKQMDECENIIHLEI